MALLALLGACQAREAFYPSRWVLEPSAPLLDALGPSAGPLLGDVALKVEGLFAGTGVSVLDFPRGMSGPEGRVRLLEDGDGIARGWDGELRGEVYDVDGLLDLVGPDWERRVHVLAVVVAHEIGHALGLPHADTPIMSPGLDLRPGVDHYFTAAELAAIARRLG